MLKSVSFLLFVLCFSMFRESVSASQSILFNEYVYKKKVIACPELTGRVVYPGMPGYEQDRLVSNFYTSRYRFPKVIVYCHTTEDVINAVKWARCHNVPIRIRSGGHNHEAFSTGTGAIVIDVSEMKQVHLDRDNRVATVQPGINNVELCGQLFEEGFTHVGGTCSEVGLSGLVLTGGMGPLLRRVGLTCDSLVFLEMIDADGRKLHVTKENQHQDLFWASCGGGGGNFSIVTLMGINVVPADDVTWFNIGWDWNQPVEEVILAWQDFFAKPDLRWFSHLDVWAQAFPIDKTKKMPVKVLGVFWGTPEEARRELAPISNVGKPTNEVIQKVNWKQAISNIEDSTAVFLTTKPEYRSTGAFAMQNLPKQAISIVGKTLRETPFPFFNFLLFSMGGAMQEIRPTETAYFYRDAPFFINYTLQWLKSDQASEGNAALNDIRQRLLPYTKGDYVGNPDVGLDDYMTAYYGDNVHRLRCIKRKYDPENVFRFEQSIPPAPIIWKCSESN